MTKTGPELQPYNIISSKETILPAVAELVVKNTKLSHLYHQLKVVGEITSSEQADKEYRKLVAFAREKLILPVWGELPSGQVYQEMSGQAYQSHNALAGLTNVRLVHCVILGHNTLGQTHQPEVRDSFIMGHNVLSGNLPHDVKPETIEKIIKEGVEAIESQAEEQSGKRLLPSQRLAQQALAELIRFATVGITIDNSVVFGWNALDGVLGEVIKNSIIGGYKPLDRANVHLQNCYIVNGEGTRYIGDDYMGARIDPVDIRKILEAGFLKSH